jgi:hypothetical protein
MDIAERDKNGLWVNSGNPAGRPPSVFASQNDVADRLLQKYTGEEIRALAADPKRCAKELSSFQEMIIIQLANALSARDNNDNALERERLLDRVVGKPIQRTEQKISVSIETEAALLEGRKRVAKARKPVEPVEVSYSVVEPVNVAIDVTPKPKPLSFNQRMALKEARDKALADATADTDGQSDDDANTD